MGIVVEYNPFHNGHYYHYLKAKEYGDVVIAVMSGDFVQRGEPAFINRWERTELALIQGVDIVVELPAFYSTQSAEIFSRGAIGILDKLNVENIVFGSECGDINILKKRVELEEGKIFKENMKNQLKKGFSYPNAYSNVLKQMQIDQRLDSNDILGIEYLKAIKFWNSKITANIIKREKTGYYSKNINDGITSATGIRESLKNGQDVKNVVPKEVYNRLKKIKNKNGFTKLDEFYPFIRYRILTDKVSLKQIQDVETGFENRLYEAAIKNSDYNEFFETIKTKRYTTGRVQRVLIHILLDIKIIDTHEIKERIPYIRVFGFTTNGQNYIKQLKSQGVEVLTSLKI